MGSREAGFERWESRYRSASPATDLEPNPFLVESAPLLGVGGQVLDVAMGDGRNALYLARLGFHVTGLDRSPTAVSLARERVRREGLELEGVVADLEGYVLPREAFDGVVVTFYLQRSLFAGIVETLRPGGWLLYQTFTTAILKYRPFNRAYLLERGELREAFEGFDIVTWREEERADEGVATACLLARKPAVLR